MLPWLFLTRWSWTHFDFGPSVQLNTRHMLIVFIFIQQSTLVRWTRKRLVLNMQIKTQLIAIDYPNSNLVAQIAGALSMVLIRLCVAAGQDPVPLSDPAPLHNLEALSLMKLIMSSHSTCRRIPSRNSGTSRWPTPDTPPRRVRSQFRRQPLREVKDWDQAAPNISSDAARPFSCPIFSRKWDFLRCFSANQQASGNFFLFFFFFHFLGNRLVKHPATHPPTRGANKHKPPSLPAAHTHPPRRTHARTHSHTRSKNNTDGIIKNTSALTLGWALESGK